MKPKYCLDLNTHWDVYLHKCVPCNYRTKPGYQLSPHCGYNDNGSQSGSPYIKCPDDHFNDGQYKLCQPCASFCASLGNLTVNFCNATTVQCEYQPRENDTVPVVTTSLPSKTSPTNQETSFSATSTMRATSMTPHSEPAGHEALWAVPLVIISIAAAVLSAYFIYRKKRRDDGIILTNTRRSLLINEGFIVFPSQPDDLEDVLSPEIQSAPLQTVLDNLDVLEELVILLDPECHSVKNTRHLASHCSFSSAWITYTYSMKDSKSPLKAVLDGITSRYPDWTVGDLAKLLRIMGRNDAVAVLAKLRGNNEMV
ncbi:hypothetical protein LDENG_00029880 [Lucifuga dentata]|nr:hypothetical protein LDENG_00029880 [Lucifuga dentata]